jgi:DNA-binding transcriptional regulator of glucitol operon
MKSKYLTKRALGLHLALVVWVSICLSAAWWQVGRAIQGSSLSYLYAIEWPAFAVLGFFGWYSLLNMERITEHQERARRDYEEKMRAEAQAAREIEVAAQPEEPAMAAYNDHLAELATQPKKRLWGH